MTTMAGWRRAPVRWLGCAGLLAALAAAGRSEADLERLDRPPAAVKQQMPEFPIELRAAGLAGEVVMELIVNEAGDVSEAHVVRANNPWFERAALDAVLKWKFEPGRKAGRAVKSRVSVPVVFPSPYGKPNELWTLRRPDKNAKLPPELMWEEAPVPTASSFPVYPRDELLAQTKGSADITYLIGTDGRVHNGQVNAATAPEFAGAVLASIDLWQFKPARRQGRPCLAAVRMLYEFDPSGQHGIAPVLAGTQAVLRELRGRKPDIVPAAQLDEIPKPISTRPPRFPSGLDKAGARGEAVVDFYIDGNGDAQLPRAVSATSPEFGFAAVQAVAAWRFTPPRRSGKAVITRMRVPVVFESRRAGSRPRAGG